MSEADGTIPSDAIRTSRTGEDWMSPSQERRKRAVVVAKRKMAEKTAAEEEEGSDPEATPDEIELFLAAQSKLTPELKESDPQAYEWALRKAERLANSAQMENRSTSPQDGTADLGAMFRVLMEKFPTAYANALKSFGSFDTGAPPSGKELDRGLDDDILLKSPPYDPNTASERRAVIEQLVSKQIKSGE